MTYQEIRIPQYVGVNAKRGTILEERASLRERLSKKSARAGDLAKHYGVDEQEIWALVQAEGSGIELAERGWLKAKGTQSQDNEENTLIK